MKRFLMVTLVVVFCLALPSVGLASDIDAGSKLVDQDSGIITPKSSGSATISKVSSTQVKIWGKSTASKDAQIAVVVKLQYYSGGKWVDYSSSAKASASTFGKSVTASKTITVKKGYKYRTFCTHTGNGSTNYSNSSSLSM